MILNQLILKGCIIKTAIDVAANVYEEVMRIADEGGEEDGREVLFDQLLVYRHL